MSCTKADYHQLSFRFGIGEREKGREREREREKERERDEGAHLVECRHGFVGAADLDLVEEGLGAGAVFAGALR